MSLSVGQHSNESPCDGIIGVNLSVAVISNQEIASEWSEAKGSNG